MAKANKGNATQATNVVDHTQAIEALIVDLRAASKGDKVKKAIRRRLRALGHRGGLRSTPVIPA